MAHHILGIDLGHYSIKLAYLEAGLRKTRLLFVKEQELPQSTTPDPITDLSERQVQVLQAILTEFSLKPEMTAASLESPGMFRVISLPFSDPKKIESVLPFELEAELLTRIEEQTIDFLVVPKGEEGSVSPKSHYVLSGIANKTEVHSLLEKLSNLGLQPKLLGAKALAIGTLCSFPSLIPKERPVALVDLGHRLTHTCILHHPIIPSFARTLERGGQELTTYLSQKLGIDREKAQALKHQANLGSGLTLSQQTSEQEAAIPSLLKEALRPLVRDLKQTLAAAVSLYGKPIEHMVLFGGGSRLKGIDLFLLQELGLSSVSLWEPPKTELTMLPMATPATDPTPADWRAVAPALGLAYALARSKPQLNFRRGELSYRTHLQLLKSKLPAFLISMIAVLICTFASIAASFYSLNREFIVLEEQLLKQTKALFGEEVSKPKEVEARLSKKDTEMQIPSFTVFDLLESLSLHAPKQVVEGGQTIAAELDVLDLEIRDQKINLKATASSAQYIEDLKKEWAGLPCIKGITTGKIQPEKNRKLFTMELTTCL